MLDIIWSEKLMWAFGLGELKCITCAELHFINFLKVNCTYCVTLIHKMVYEINQSFLCWLTSTIYRKAFGSLVKVGCFKLSIWFFDVRLLRSITNQKILSLKWSSRVFLLNKSWHSMVTILLNSRQQQDLCIWYRKLYYFS